MFDLVHMEKSVAGAIIEGGILDVLAYDARALLVAAAEEIGADVMIRVVVGVLTSVAVGLGHDDPPRKRPRGMPHQWTATRAHSRSNNPPWTRHPAWFDGQTAELSRTSEKFASLCRTYEKDFSTTLFACRRH
ncbi:hypothetical protein MTX20_34755 [Bradyrhizobium sp. ISRA435]|nr:hypothetical protein MTX20_34755 [Bradyrhizobium sp. ISRA435]